MHSIHDPVTVCYRRSVQEIRFLMYFGSHASCFKAPLFCIWIQNNSVHLKLQNNIAKRIRFESVDIFSCSTKALKENDNFKRVKVNRTKAD